MHAVSNVLPRFDCVACSRISLVFDTYTFWFCFNHLMVLNLLHRFAWRVGAPYIDHVDRVGVLQFPYVRFVGLCSGCTWCVRFWFLIVFGSSFWVRFASVNAPGIRFVPNYFCFWERRATDLIFSSWRFWHYFPLVCVRLWFESCQNIT
jgi:hypothetical protein